jgi:peptidoglycan/LPS O-acetylase OafA/YrhL
MTSWFDGRQPWSRFGALRSGSSSSDTARSRRLDGIRGIAALGVLVYHCIYFSGFWTQLYLRSRTAGAFVATLGNFCVTVFFALSGFLLFREFLGRILFNEDAAPTKRYILRRFLRIYPAYWVALAAFVVLIGANRLHGSVFGLVTLMERNLNNSAKYPGIQVTWTLLIEVAFYVFLPIAAALLSRLCRWKPLGTRVQIVVAFLIALSAFSLVWVFLADNFANNDLRLRENLPTYLIWFAAGMGLAVVHCCHQRGFFIAARISRLAMHPWWCWASAFLLICGLARMKTPLTASETTVQMQIRLALLAIAAFLVILPLVLPSQPSRIHEIVGSRRLAWVGLVSYGVYLWHLIVILKLTELVEFEPTLVGSLLLLVLALPGSLVLGWTSFRLIEKPAMSMAPSTPAGSVGTQQDR